MCICRCCLVTIFGSSTEISFKAREGERWLGDAAAVGSREHQCMLLANCSLTAPKRRLAGWRSQLPSNCNYYIQETTTRKNNLMSEDGKIKKFCEMNHKSLLFRSRLSEDKSTGSVSSSDLCLHWFMLYCCRVKSICIYLLCPQSTKTDVRHHNPSILVNLAV